MKVPKTIQNLVKRKTATAFLDGDRGGDLILKELMQVARPKFVARAPRGKEVEELTLEEIRAALSKKVPLEEVEDESKFAGLVEELKGTLEAVLMKGGGKQMDRIPVSELVDRLKKEGGVEVVVFDGIITGRLIDAAVERGVRTLVGERVAEGVKVPRSLKVQLFRDL